MLKNYCLFLLIFAFSPDAVALSTQTAITIHNKHLDLSDQSGVLLRDMQELLKATEKLKQDAVAITQLIDSERFKIQSKHDDLMRLLLSANPHIDHFRNKANMTINNMACMLTFKALSIMNQPGTPFIKVTDLFTDLFAFKGGWFVLGYTILMHIIFQIEPILFSVWYHSAHAVSFCLQMQECNITQT